MAHSHLYRRSHLQSLGSLPRLGELVDQLLFERQVAVPPLALDPEILKLLPY